MVKLGLGRVVGHEFFILLFVHNVLMLIFDCFQSLLRFSVCITYLFYFKYILIVTAFYYIVFVDLMKNINTDSSGVTKKIY